MADIFRLDLGPAPCAEDCVQVSDSENYLPAMRKESKRYVDLLARLFPDCEKHGVYFKLVTSPHDFGSYIQVEVQCAANNEAGVKYACHIEGNLPSTWEG